MKISSTKYPLDILLCMLWSIVLLPITLLSMDTIVRTFLGLPFILFIPGYILIFALFPSKKTDRGIDMIERIALSFGLSIAIVPLLGLVLNYTPWGIRLEPILLSLFFFIMGVGLLAIFRWRRIPADERFIISFQLSPPKSTNKLDTSLTILLAVAIVIALAALLYVLVTPKTGERFTEFYLLGPTGKATEYPRNLTTGENATVIIGLANHEYTLMNYTIEIWLINQTTEYNTTTKINQTMYHHMWFMDSIPVTLNSTPVTTDQPWTVQWQQNYTVAITKKGDFKLSFILSTTPTETYNQQEDYVQIAAQKIENAYREVHLWLSIH
jgi:uncharacterized membrane protein